MKIALMTDIEGVAGLVNFEDWALPESRYYEKGKMLLTEEVNAAVRGLFDAGADEVIVIDGHGHGAIDTVLLDKRAQFSRGWGVYHQFGLADHFDAFITVGQHAKAGTIKSHITHTGSFDAIEARINGISVGEYGQCVMIAGFYGTPAIFAAGERAFCEEAKALTPWVHTAEGKYGVTLDNGINCTEEEYRVHNLGAVHVHPEVARERIYAAAKASLEDFIRNPDKFKVLCPEPPYTYELWLRASAKQPARKLIRRHATDIVAMFGAPDEILPEGTYELPYAYQQVEP